LGADLSHQVGTGHGGLFPHPIEQCPRVGLDGADCRTHDALVPQVTGEGTGSCESDPDHALAAHLLGQGTLGTPVGGDSGRFSNDEPGHPDTSGLGILAVDAGVADVRRGHHHDLSVVGGVGECRLVTGHTAVEDGFSEGLAGGSEAAAMEDPAVLEHQDRGAARFLGHVVTLHRARSVLAICCCVHLIRPSRTVGVPRRNVARTRPGRVMPRKGVLLLLVTMAGPSTSVGSAGSYRTTLAGSPSARVPPCPSTSPIRAGAVDMRSATWDQVSSPVSTMVRCTTASAVSSPTIPMAAVDHSVSLASTG